MFTKLNVNVIVWGRFFSVVNERIWSANIKANVQFSKFELLFELQAVTLSKKINTVRTVTDVTTLASGRSRV